MLSPLDFIPEANIRGLYARKASKLVSHGTSLCDRLCANKVESNVGYDASRGDILRSIGFSVVNGNGRVDLDRLGSSPDTHERIDRPSEPTRAKASGC